MIANRPFRALSSSSVRGSPPVFPAWTASISAIRNIRSSWRKSPILPPASGFAAIARCSRTIAVAVIGARAASHEGLIAADEIALRPRARRRRRRQRPGARHRLGRASRRARRRRQDHRRARHGHRSGLSRGERLRSAERIAASGLLVTEFPPGSPPEDWHFPAAQSHHQRPLESRRRRRGQGEERLADHGPTGRRSGPRRDGRARHDRRRPQPRRERLVEGWGKAR